MNIFSAVDESEMAPMADQIWQEEFSVGNQPGSQNYPIYRFLFRLSLWAGEKDLQARGLLELFRRTQELPDYARAEDAIRRGWATWAKNELRITPQTASDYLAVLQALLLFGIRCEPDRKRELRIGRASKLLDLSRKRNDRSFLRKLRHDKAQPQRMREGYGEFMQVVLANWLTAFWWLMPLKSVANDMARIQGVKSNVAKFYQNLRQITTRRTPPSHGAFFSAGWNGVLYSAKPAVIDFIESDGSPVISRAYRRVLR